MTLNEITHKILDIAKEEKNINYVGEGDIYSLNSTPNIDYSVFFVTHNNTQVSQDYIQYSFVFFYVDRLINEADDSNKLKIMSDGIQHIINICNKLNNDIDVDIVYPLQFTSFRQRFSDDCAGQFCTVNIIVDNNLGSCEY